MYPMPRDRGGIGRMGNKHRKQSIFTINRKFKLGGVIVKLHGVGGVGWS